MRITMMICAVLLVGLLMGCGQSDLMKALAPSADQQAARSYIDLLRQHKFDQIEKATDPSIVTPGLHDTLVKMAVAMPSQDPVSVKVVGLNTFRGNGVSKDNVTFEYQYPDRWLLANVALLKTNGATTIIGFNVNPLSDSLERINRFTLRNKGVAQYSVLALAVLALLVSIYALGLCARTRMKGRKWLWIVFILCGVGKLSVNWTTGQWDFMPLSIQLFSASAFSGFYSPWIVSVSFPLGAIWFLLRRKHLAASAVPPALPVTELREAQ